MRWTKVTTRVPKKPGPYIVYDGKRVVMETTHPSWWNYRPRSPIQHQGPKVTHWMALPKSPKVAR